MTGPANRHRVLSLVVMAAVLAGGLAVAVAAGRGTDMPPPRPVPTPPVGATWQVQLTGRVDTTVRADVFEIDAIDAPSAVVDALHRRGRFVICYMSAGTFEPWRPDAAAFPRRALGRPLADFPDERWLDVRAIELLRPIIEARVRHCRDKGFDGIDFDNVDGYRNRTGFSITAAEQLAYNRLLASLARRYGLAAGLKNAIDLVPELVPDFAFAVNEECVGFDECEALVPFIDAGKPVFHLEYDVPLSRFCPATTALGFSSIRKKPDLGSFRRVCPS